MNGQLIVKQFLLGQWVEFIRLDAEEGIDGFQIEESLTTMKDLIFAGGTVNISNDTSVVIFNKSDGPVKIDYVVDQYSR